MPFSDEFHGFRNKGTQVAGLQGCVYRSGVLQFTKSPGHADTLYYEVRIYTINTSTVVAYRNLGKYWPDSDGTIRVDITTLLTPLSSGDYTAKVTAVGKNGSDESTGDDFSLPLT